MGNLKNQIFTLLKKCPSFTRTNQIHYYTDSIVYAVALYPKFKQEGLDYCAIITISSENGQYQKTVELTEKEYMDIKWTIEEWHEVLEVKAFDDFAKFAESEPNSMDDLLND